MDEILDYLFSYLRDNFDIETGILALTDRRKNILTFYKPEHAPHFEDDMKAYLAELTIPMKEYQGIMGRVFSRQKPFYLPRTDYDFPDEIDRRFIETLKLSELLIVPLVIYNKVNAIIFLTNYKTRMNLTRAGIKRISIFLDQISGAINSSSLLEDVKAEREKSDKLLLNILPEKVAEELKEKDEVEPLIYDSVSVLFTDFVGFTKIGMSISPDELIRELDGCFTQFDEIIARFKLEKLKTIGDSYMCAGGLPVTNTTHPVDACLAALEFQAFMNQMRKIKGDMGLSYWELRLGINTGPVTAGVVGKHKFAYDIWGDTVNTASRMESSGVPGRVNISGATYELVRDYFECEYRGEIEAKGKGRVPMYYVNRIREQLSADDAGRLPNDDFKQMYGKISNGTSFK